MKRYDQLAFVLLGFLMAPLSCESSASQIPTQIWQMMKDRNISSTLDFLSLVRPRPGQSVGHLPPSPGGSHPGQSPSNDPLFTEEGTLNPGAAGELSNLVDIDKDMCEVKLISHEIPVDPSEPMALFWPQCVKLDRCSGCCDNELLKCTPTLETTVSYMVVKAIYPFPGADYFEFDSVQDMTFSRHLACSCQCRVQPHDCVPGIQVYNAAACRCDCINIWESLSCSAPKIWSNEECSCVCPQSWRLCYDDEVYSEDSCSCVRTSNPGYVPPQQNENIDAYLYCLEIMDCRAGFTPGLDINGECDCFIGNQQTLEGTLIGSQPLPSNNQPSAPNQNPAAGAPIIVADPETTTPTPRPTRPPRATRRPRPGRPRG